jgi:hypothetical protein
VAPFRTRPSIGPGSERVDGDGGGIFGFGEAAGFVMLRLPVMENRSMGVFRRDGQGRA